MILFLDTISPEPKFVLIYNGNIVDYIHILDKNSIKISESICKKFSIFQKKNKFLNDLKKLVVCTGPGSYTSLRVGISFMLGLSFSKQIPIIGLTGIELLSESILLKDFEKTFLIICSLNKQNFICEPKKSSNYQYSTKKINDDGLLSEILLKKYSNCVSNFALSDKLNKIISLSVDKIQHINFEENLILNLSLLMKKQKLIKPMYISENNLFD